MTRDPAHIQALARAITAGDVIRCTCGEWVHNTPDDRWRHRVMFEHAVSDDGKEAEL